MINRAEVLIYYANETPREPAARANYDAVIQVLAASSDPRHQRIAVQLQRDVLLFPEIVAAEILALGRAVAKAHIDLHALVFTNSLVRDGQFLCFTGGREDARLGEWGLSSVTDPVQTAHPLSSAASLRNAFAHAARLFSPAEHDFVLITKSHGSEDVAMTPRLVVNVNDWAPGQLLSLAVGELPDWKRPAIGVTHTEWCSALVWAGLELKMRFSVAFLESCKAEHLIQHGRERPACVERLFLLGNSQQVYQTLDYTELVGAAETGTGFAATLVTALRAKGFREV